MLPLVSKNLWQWIEENRAAFEPPVGNKVVWEDSQYTAMVVRGPNARRDFHIDPSDEIFYQLKGDIVVEHLDRQAGEPQCDFGRGPEQCIPGAFIRSNDFPRLAVNKANGHLYATWQDYRNGEYDIQMARSLNQAWETSQGNSPAAPTAS